MSKQNDLLEPNPFANPIVAEQGNPQARDIFTSMGHALHEWESCELSVGVLYSAFVKPEGPNHTVLRAWGVIVASATRKEMTVAACDVYFLSYQNEDLWKQTRHLMNIYKDAASRRNEIAHSMVMGPSRHKREGNKIIPLSTIYYLVPPLFATRKLKGPSLQPSYRYSTKEIDHFATCFGELGRRLALLSRDVRNFYEALHEKHG